MKSFKTVALFAFLAAPLSAAAATIALPDNLGGTFSATLVATGTAAQNGVDQSQSTVLPGGAYWTTSPEILPNETYGIAPDVVADPCMYACSPFYSGVLGDPSNDGVAGWETTPFFTVFDTPGDLPSIMRQAVLAFSQSQSMLSLLWGSPDEKNALDLIFDGQIVASFWGADFNWFWETDPGIVGHPGRGAALLQISGLTFDSIRFSTWSSDGSFEFSNVTTTPVPSPVPLPPAIFALMAGMGALAVAARKRVRA